MIIFLFFFFLLSRVSCVAAQTRNNGPTRRGKVHITWFSHRVSQSLLHDWLDRFGVSNYGIDHLEMWRAMLSFFLRYRWKLSWKIASPWATVSFPRAKWLVFPQLILMVWGGKIDRALGLHVFLSVLCSVSLQPFSREVATCATLMVGKCSLGKIQS